ncbi:MAG: hypothetical protein ACI9VR_004907 [Cognaticolwellia sp.]|jgi:hypothetical protein
MPSQTRRPLNTPQTAQSGTSAGQAQGQEQAGMGNAFAASQMATPPRATDLVLRYRKSVIEGQAMKHPGARKALSAIKDYGLNSVQDGAQLSDAQKLCVAFDAMSGDPEREQLLSAIFFGDVNLHMGEDHISEVRGSLSGVTVEFFNPDSGTVLQPQTFAGPVAYTGVDTNLREKRVQAAKGGFVSDRGNRVAYSNDSFVRGQMTSIAFDFVNGKDGAEFKDMPAAERQATPGYKAALQDYIYGTVLHLRADKIAFQRRGLVDAWLAANPAPATGGEAWAARFANEAMRAIITYDNPEFYAVSHSSWRVEDEAAAQILVESLMPGMEVNFDADAMMIGIVSMPPAKVAAAAPIASTVVEPPPSDLPVVTKNMSALRGHMNTTDKYLSGEGRSKHGLRVGPGCALNQYMDGEGTALWGTLGIDGNANLAGSLYRIGKTAELVPYRKFLEAWYDWEDAQANSGDAAAKKAAFDAALGNFLAALNDGINGF